MATGVVAGKMHQTDYRPAKWTTPPCWAARRGRAGRPIGERSPRTLVSAWNVTGPRAKKPESLLADQLGKQTLLSGHPQVFTVAPAVYISGLCR